MASPRRPRPPPPQPRKRISAVRLSTDTTSSLPAYSSPTFAHTPSASDWQNNQPPHSIPIDDQPPDYPQSAEEADQEDVDDFVPLRGPRSARRLRHRRSESYAGSSSIPTSPSVDDLLERSVVALELSTNALMQSIDTQSSLSAISNDRILERSLDRQARMLNVRIRGNRSVHEGWMDDLDEVMRGVDGLLAEGDENDGVSRSLPTTSDMPQPRHRPSLNLAKAKSESPYLHLSTSSELDLRGSLRPPRALTQYVSVESSLGEASEATADPQSIFLPSTNGLRAAAHIRRFSGSAGTRPRPRPLRQSVSAPGPDLLHSSAPSTPAYTMLSHLARQSSRSPSLTRTVSPPPPSASQSSPVSESTHRRKTRRHSGGSMDSNFTFTSNLHRSRSNSQGRSSASTETPPMPPVRAMTPPMEENTPSSSSDSSSSSPKKANAFRAMQSLRKILNDAPPDPKGKRSAALEARALRRTFQPRTPSVTASAGTSTATASVSRLLTRSSHHSSHMPRQSSLKHSRSAPQTPSIPGTPNFSAPESRLSSTPSTPRQVSFAELPDSYSGRPRRKGKDKGKGKGKKDNSREDGQWWKAWFTGGGSGMAAARYDERMEDRLLRGWGRPGVGGGGTDEWMM